ncbi:MAG: hypothetical protein JWM64_2255 [Frankiales bacterium]|nr:hypothetical protein [Frankiales bacterium]
MPGPPVPRPPAAAWGPPPSVVAALDALEGVLDRPLEEHVQVYDDVHRRLQDALAALDQP